MAAPSPRYLASCMARRVPSNIDRDDLEQEAAIALWQAQQAGHPDAIGVRKAWFAMLDFLRRQDHLSRKHRRERKAHGLPDAPHLHSPEHLAHLVDPAPQPWEALQVKRAIARIRSNSKAARLMDCYLYGAVSHRELAQEWAISPSRVSQLWESLCANVLSGGRQKTVSHLPMTWDATAPSVPPWP